MAIVVLTVYIKGPVLETLGQSDKVQQVPTLQEVVFQLL
jgi:hypothetical protein